MPRLPTVLACALMLLPAVPLAAFGDTMSDTSLHAAAANDDVARIEALLAAGTPIDARDKSGATALLVATHADHLAAAQALIAAGADVNAKDNIGASPYLY